MPIFDLDKALDLLRTLTKLGNSKGATARTPGSGARLPEDRVEDPENTRQRSEQRERLRDKRHELRRIQEEFRVAEVPAENAEHRRRKKKIQQELFKLRRELAATKDRPGTGSLPDFIIIGAKKGGTTSLYQLLTRHPHVEPAALKEPHYFDTLFDEGIDWYRQCFPSSGWKDGRKTITGEATPYLSYPPAPRRIAEVVPNVRLIVLLRDPIDRAYSDFYQVAKRWREDRTFEEAVEAEMARLPEKNASSAHEDCVDLDARLGYLYRSLYVDQLLRWSVFFGKEQLLVLKSEDFFERTSDTFELVLDFLGLPTWRPEAWEIANRGVQRREINPVVRQRLEEFFEPYNRRLYDHLGVDFGW